jgi:septal ring factor EnvC (AmiA/AmiB activator)
MARTKGSKNKVVSVEDRIAAVTSDIEKLQTTLKEKKAELKQLNVEKSEVDQRRLLTAVSASGKSVEEVIALLSEQNEG